MIRQIVIIDAKRGVAKAGDQPVHLPADQAYFRDMTLSKGGAVLMGKKTYDVIGLLKQRRNYIATRERIAIPGATIVGDVTTFLRDFSEDIWIIGGASIYAATFELADELYVTEIDADLACDQFYPEYKQQFELVSQSPPQTEAGLTYRFCVYRKRT